MEKFKSQLIKKIKDSLDKEFDDNFEDLRFYKTNKIGIKGFFRKKFVYPNYIARWKHKQIIQNTHHEIAALLNELDGLSELYNLLFDDCSKSLLVDIVAFRILGHEKVKLPTNNEQYQSYKEKAKKARISTEKLNVKRNENIEEFFLNEIGYDLHFFYTTLGVIIDFLLEQYAYKTKDISIMAKEGDIVIEAGGCWGNSALYFATKVKEKGKVYSFEFIPSNLEVFKKNLELNKQFGRIIEVQEKPLWEKPGKEIFFVDEGAGSSIRLNKPKKYEGKKRTTTIDELIDSKGLKKLDLIALDVEGAELSVLKGGVNAIIAFKPNLAISVYHQLKDFSEISKWIDELNLGYRFFLGHYSIYSEETVLFAITR